MKPILNSKFYLFALGILGVIFLLFVAKSNIFSTRSWQQFWNLGHIPLFVLAGYVVYHFYPTLQAKSLRTQILLLALMACCAGVVIEFIQSLVGRQASLQDVMLDVVGGLVSFVIFSRRVRQFGVYKMTLSVMLVVSILLMAAWAVVSPLRDEYLARRDFPLLADFERAGELGRWSSVETMAISADVAKQGKKSLKITLTPRAYSGVELEYFPGDWSRYRNLGLSVFVAEPGPISLTVSIFDNKHHANRFAFTDRFTKSFRLQHGWNEVSVSLDAVKQAPRERQMDMRNIDGLRLFVVRPNKIQYLYIDDIRLKN